MRSIRFTYILLEALTLAVALFFSLLLLYTLQKGIKERYIARHVTSIETIEIMVEKFLNDNTMAFANFMEMPNRERASMLRPVFSDIYYCDNKLHIAMIITKEEDSHIFAGYDLGKSKVGPFLMGLGPGKPRHSPMYRSPENDGLSVYIAAQRGDGFLVGRIGMEKFREYLSRMAGYANSIIMLATNDGYILLSTDMSHQVNVLPDRAEKELELSGKKYLYTKKHSAKLDNYIAIFTPLENVYDIVRSVQASIVVFVAVIFMVIVSKVIWQSVKMIQPLGRLSAYLGAWNIDRVGLDLPKQFIAYEEISLLYDSFREKSAQINNAVNALRESEEKFRTTLSAMVDQVFVFSGEGRFVLCHAPGSVGDGVFSCDSVGKIFSDVMIGDMAEKFGAAFDANRRGGQAEFDFSADRAGEARWYSAKVSPNNIGGVYGGSIAVIRDITERKRAEEQARTDLKEKDVLLKEIHHRVKNNLNVITSLLGLQSDQLEGKGEVVEAFRESRNRIFSMALVHEKLYQTKDYTRVNFKEYIEEMAGELMRAYAVGNNVSLEYGIDNVLLDINMAIPCGLILNELVSNALKHAFPGMAPGTIGIFLRAGEGGSHELIVSDNGRGLPPGFDIEAVESLGLKLVKILSEQIGGTLAIESGRGAKFTIAFTDGSS
ncbi:MAG: PAS domain S-box protein [Spirochaetes bacterium]|nr:PAS domain S-box protein [Spirochaetota bacterium]